LLALVEHRIHHAGVEHLIELVELIGPAPTAKTASSRLGRRSCPVGLVAHIAHPLDVTADQLPRLSSGPQFLAGHHLRPLDV